MGAWWHPSQAVSIVTNLSPCGEGLGLELKITLLPPGQIAENLQAMLLQGYLQWFVVGGYSWSNVSLYIILNDMITGWNLSGRDVTEQWWQQLNELSKGGKTWICNAILVAKWYRVWTYLPSTYCIKCKNVPAWMVPLLCCSWSGVFTGCGSFLVCPLMFSLAYALKCLWTLIFTYFNAFVLVTVF